MTGMRDKIAQAAKTTKTARAAQTVSGTKAGEEPRPVVVPPFKRPSGRASFPRRMTLDLDPVRFEWLRRQAYQSRVPAAALLRSAIDALQGDDALLVEVVERAVMEHPPPT